MLPHMPDRRNSSPTEAGGVLKATAALQICRYARPRTVRTERQQTARYALVDAHAPFFEKNAARLPSVRRRKCRAENAGSGVFLTAFGSGTQEGSQAYTHQAGECPK